MQGGGDREALSLLLGRLAYGLVRRLPEWDFGAPCLNSSSDTVWLCDLELIPSGWDSVFPTSLG